MSDLASVTAGLATGRPAFIADLAAMYYEPKVKVEAPTRFFNDDHGRRWRRCWVWFPEINGVGPRNHNIHIDQYGNGWWELGIGCHCSCKQITVRSRTEPTDDEARDLLRMAGWPGWATT